MKKLSLFLLIFMGLGACCGGIEEHWEVSDFSISFLNKNYEQIDTDTTGVVDLGLSIDFDANFIAKNDIPIAAAFMPSAYALTCEKSGHQGLVDKIASIDITSNQAYNYFAANTSLNNILFAFNSNTNVNTFVDQQEELNFPYTGNYIFYFSERPTNNKTHVFTVTITFESGESIQKESRPITWE